MINLSTWRSWRKVFVRGSRLSSVQQREQFRDIVMRMRAGADRNQHVFSLLLFNVGDPEVNRLAVQYLAHVLTNRVRLTDEVGWFDDKHMGVLLPYTSTDGAQKLANNICQAIATKASPPEYNIYTYPFEWPSNGNGNLSQLHFADLSPEWKTITPRDISTAKQANGGSNIFGTQIASNDTNLSGGILAHAIEPFFLNQLPLWKRVMDVVGALFGLVVLSPILLLIALIIKITSPGPVFYKQQRIGHFGKVFIMWKFRTMRVDIDTFQHQQHITNLVNSQRPMAKLANDSQTTLFGNALRISCLDELPQLINVLCGDMSLVGPRPDVTYTHQYYTHWRTERFHAVPGMTGLWQVNGKNKISFDEMIRLDITYVRQMTFWLDLKIILKTLPVIITQVKDILLERK